MELKPWTYEEMPDYDGVPEGATLIATTGDEGGVAYTHDVVYAKTPQGDLRLQIMTPFSRNCQPAVKMPFMPAVPEGFFDNNPQYPCVVYVQGSAWFPQDCYNQIPMLGKLAARGFVVAVVEYRSSLVATFPTQILDTQNAIRFLKLNAKEYCIDPEKVVVMGNSSGGHTAFMAGVWSEEDKGDNYYPGTSASVKGVISQYASGDLTFEDSNPSTPNHNKADSPEGMVMGHVDLTPEMAEALSCKTYISKEAPMPPTLLFHGTKDRIVNVKCSIYLYEKMKACGKDATLYLLKGADHGGNEFWTDEMLDVIEKFIRRVI